MFISKALDAKQKATRFRSIINPNTQLDSFIVIHPDDITEIETPDGYGVAYLNDMFALVYRAYAK